MELRRASGVHPSSELARTLGEDCDEPGPFCNPRSEMRARTETREKASRGLAFPQPDSRAPQPRALRSNGTTLPNKRPDASTATRRATRANPSSAVASNHCEAHRTPISQEGLSELQVRRHAPLERGYTAQSRSKRGGVPKLLRLCDNTPPRNPHYFL